MMTTAWLHPIVVFTLTHKRYFTMLMPSKRNFLSISGDVIVPPILLVLSKKLIFILSLIHPAGLQPTGATSVIANVTFINRGTW